MLHKIVSLEDQIRAQAAALGFTLCGFTRLSPLPREQFLSDWLAGGYAGEMSYLAREPERRLNPAIPFPQARSVICLGYPYAPPRNNRHVTIRCRGISRIVSEGAVDPYPTRG